MQQFELEQRDLGDGNCEIVVAGELDLAVADRLDAAIDAVDAEHTGIVIQLSECEFIDSTGIAVILRAHRRFAEDGRCLVACCASEQAQRILDLTGLRADGLVYDNLDGAIGRIRDARAH